MSNNPVGWFEIYVQDMARARNFYETVFAVILVKLPGTELEMWSFPMTIDRYGAPGALVKMDGVDPGGNSVLVYFSCADCGVEESRVAAAGGQVVKPRFSIGAYGYISLVSDSEGNMIGLHSRE